MLLGTESVGLEVPTSVLWAAFSFVGFGIVAWLAKGKADRWDQAAERTHDHANTLTNHEARLDHIEGKKK